MTLLVPDIWHEAHVGPLKSTPGVQSGSGFPVIFVSKGIIDIPMLGFGENLDLGMIRTEVALSAGLGFSGFHHGKTMSCVTTGVAAFTAVQV